MHAEQAIERYGPLVMSLIWRINGNHDETADLYQEVFVKFHETTSERGPLQQPKAWLCRTAINAALDFKRQRSRFVSWTESAEQPHNWEANDVDVVENGLMVEKIRHLAVGFLYVDSADQAPKAIPADGISIADRQVHDPHLGVQG